MVSQGSLASLISAVKSTTITEVAALAIVAFLLQWLLIVIYRLTLHPLARYPGRTIDKITSWPHVFRCYSGNRHVELLKLHQRYGHVVRTGPNWLDFDTSSAQQAINRDRNTNTDKDYWYTLEPAMTGETSVQTIIDKREHDYRRRILAPAFSDAALRNHEAIINISVCLFLDKMAGEDARKELDGWSEAKDFSTWITYFGYDFISDLAFGSRLGLLDDETQRYIPDMVIRLSHFIYYAAYLPCGGLVRWLVSTQLMAYLDPCAADGFKFTAKSASMLAQRQAAEQEAEVRKDIFHYLLNSKDPETGSGFTQEQLTADSVLLLAAGSDGVSITLSAALFYLLRSPGTLEKLTSEIRDTFSSIDDVRGPELSKLSYLDAVVNEVLRLAPAVPSALPRIVLPGGLNIEDILVPSGTTVGVSPYTIHHNETYFPDSFTFRPERWIESEKNDTSIARRALSTFGAGRFGCVGRNLAVLATKQLLAKMLWSYDVRASGGVITGGGSPKLGRGRDREGEYQLIDVAVSARSGPSVQLRARTLPA